MVTRRGEVWWANLGPVAGSAPAKRRPIVVVQADAFNESRIGTVIAAVITSNMRLSEAPGNVLLLRNHSKLPRDSVVNVSQVVTLDRRSLDTCVSKVDAVTMASVDDGLRLALNL